MPRTVVSRAKHLNSSQSEMREMDLRMAILEHALRQSRMRTKNDTFQELLRFKFAPGMSAMGKRGTVLR